MEGDVDALQVTAASRAVDVNQIVGLFWRRLDTRATDLTAFRVESKRILETPDPGSRRWKICMTSSV